MKRACTLLLLVSGIWPFGLVDAAGTHYFDTGVSYQSGDFGSTLDSTLTQLELTWGAFEPGYDYSVAFTYMSLDDGFTRETGIGDIVLRAGTEIHEDAGTGNSLYISGAVKLPTADETRGLGTGEADVGAFLSYRHQLDTLALTLDLGYIITGDPPGITYDNTLTWGVGLSKTLENTYLFAGLNGGQQSLPGFKDPLELAGGFFRRYAENRYLRGSVALGLSDGSPDLAVGVGITNWF